MKCENLQTLLLMSIILNDSMYIDDLVHSELKIDTTEITKCIYLGKQVEVKLEQYRLH